MPNKNKIKNYLSLVKFSHTIFAMPFALVGYFLAVSEQGNVFNLRLFVYVLLCMVFARNAAMAFNRYIDRSIDQKNPRTALREIPAGIINANSAMLFVVANALMFIVTTYFINRICFYLSPVALVIILGYSFTKKFTALCHFILGVGLSLAPIGAYLAVTGKFALLPVLYSVIVLLWVTGFDIIYALQDFSFDSGENLKSLPVFLGKKKALLLSRVLHTISSLIVVYTIFVLNCSWIYITGAGIFVLLLIIQQALVRHDDLKNVNLAFFTTNGVASVTFAAFFILDLYF